MWWQYVIIKFGLELSLVEKKKDSLSQVSRECKRVNGHLRKSFLFNDLTFLFTQKKETLYKYRIDPNKRLCSNKCLCRFSKNNVNLH